MGTDLKSRRLRAIAKAEKGDVEAMMDYCATFPEVELAATRD